MLDAALARRIRLVGLDVDGVLTDNGVYLGAHSGQRIELKRFDIQDGMGIVLLRGAGIPVVLVSGRVSDATLERAAELPLAGVVQVASARKLPELERLMAEQGVTWNEVAFVGDDLADLPVLRRAALPIAVANAVPEVRREARLITDAPGGRGAVREVAERLLKARGEWEAAVARYLEERGEPPA